MTELETHVHERIAAEAAELHRQLEGTVKIRKAAFKEYDREDVAAKKYMDVVIAADEAGKRDEAAEAKAEAHHNRVMAALGTVIGQARAAQRFRDRLAELQHPVEVKRRVEQAMRLEELRTKGLETKGDEVKVPRGPTVREAAAIVLGEAKGEALHAKEIARRMLDAGLIKPRGTTPEATVASALAVASKEGDTFNRVAPGTYALKGGGS